MTDCMFPNLFSPLKVGTQTYDNRVEIAPMGSFNRVTMDMVDSILAKYDAKFHSGAAVFIFGETAVSPSGSRGVCPLNDYTDLSEDHLKPYKLIADEIHSHNMKCLVELCHVGEAKVDTENPAYGPMEYVRESDGIHIHAMSKADIKQTCIDFANASYFLKKAGFDGVCIHGGHGWLFTQFLSPRTNQRKDEYGGSIENRSRITCEVMQAIREKCGTEFIIEIRISGSEHADGGYSVEDVCRYAQNIEPYCDLIHVSAGLYRDPMRTWQTTTLYEDHGCNVPVAAEIKKHVSIPVSCVGGMNSPEQAEQFIADGKIDAVVLGRQLKADPDFLKKAGEGKENEIRRCLRCMRCFPGPFEEAMAELNGKFPMGCTINPYDLHPEMKNAPKAEIAKKIMVVGGGVAGLQTAITACDRGHDVILIEKSDSLGGILNYAKDDPDKIDLYNFARTMEYTAHNHGVKILLNTVCTPELLSELKPDEVIIAIGSTPICPPLPGLNNPSVIAALDAYALNSKIGNAVLVLGGGLVGCETAVQLACSGKTVSIVEMRGELAPDAYRLHKHKLRDLVTEKCTVYLNTTCMEIMTNGVRVCNEDGIEKFIGADTVIAALGMKANSTEDIVAMVESIGIPHHEIGDCVHARKIFEAIDEGFMTAIAL